MEKVIVCDTALQVEKVIEKYSLERLREGRERILSAVKEGQVGIFIERDSWEPMNETFRFVSFFEWDMENKGQEPLEKEQTFEITFTRNWSYGVSHEQTERITATTRSEALRIFWSGRNKEAWDVLKVEQV
jgi:hypothetical protein